MTKKQYAKIKIGDIFLSESSFYEVKLKHMNADYLLLTENGTKDLWVAGKFVLDCDMIDKKDCEELFI